MPFVNQQRILIADDELDVLNLVTQSLAPSGYDIARAADGQDALDKARRLDPALVILDLMMPKMTGTDVLRALKTDPRTSAISVMMLTARKDEGDRIVCLELGADDYVVKPFSPRELALRVKSILSRRSGPPPNNRFAQHGAIILGRDGHEGKVKGRRVDLTAVEYKLLSALFRYPSRVFSREELLNAVWGMDSDIEIRTVDTHMRRLR